MKTRATKLLRRRYGGLKIGAAGLILLLCNASLYAQGQPWYQSDFPPEEFRARWAKVFKAIGGEAVALVQGVPQTNGFIFPRQHNDFYYLCGIETPQSYLLLDGRSRKVTLYLPPRNPRLEAAEGKVLSAEDADLVKRLVGVDEVLSTDAMKADWLGAGRNQPRAIYAQFSPQEGAEQSRYELNASDAAIAADHWDGRLPRQLHFIGLLRARYPRAEVRDLTPILDEMRGVKSPREVALIRRASQLAGLGILEAMRSTRPGIREYELDAVARYIFLVNGAKLEGYRSIIAGGTDNIWNMHYYRNNGELRSGDLVLMDYAPDYRYYVSDVTRMWPVSGKFAPWQRELLGFVLEYRNVILSRIRPGVTAVQIREEAKPAMESLFARWKFSKPIYEQAARRLVATGGGVFSHPVGLAVHDDGEYIRKPLQPGHVFSIDPQLRVPEENLYIRYEDVVVVTANGVENFTEFLASELDDIEKLVGQQGLLQKLPPAPGPPAPGPPTPGPPTP
ncbi:MAG: aminopeptidase P N-terminal domain-containing protein [Candidatus Acidiferrales bacterium]